MVYILSSSVQRTKMSRPPEYAIALSVRFLNIDIRSVELPITGMGVGSSIFMRIRLSSGNSATSDAISLMIACKSTLSHSIRLLPSSKRVIVDTSLSNCVRRWQ